ncbi:MAG: hypothetical protein AAFO74_16815 [Pseudomonadota bacterium]
MKLHVIFALGALIASTGCQSSYGGARGAAPNPLLLQPAINSVPASGLVPQNLDPGECGLFLWSQTDTSKFIFFSRALSGEAVFAQGEEPMILAQATAGGEIFGQFTTRMGYLSPDGRSIDLSFEPDEVLQDGQRLRNGLLTITDPEGWLTKLPVLGVRACQPEG